MLNKKSYLLQTALIIFEATKLKYARNVTKLSPIVKLFFFSSKKFFDRLPLFKRHPSLMLPVATILPVSQSKTGFAPSNLVENPLQSKQLVVELMTANLSTGWVEDTSQSFIRRLTK